MLANKLEENDQIEIDQNPGETITTTTTTTTAIAKVHRIRKTLSFISSNRKRAAKFCTINRMKRGGRGGGGVAGHHHHVRHLSMNAGQKKLTSTHYLGVDQIKACGGLGLSPCLVKKKQQKVWPSNSVVVVHHSPCQVSKSSSSDSIKSTASINNATKANGKPPLLFVTNKNHHQRFLLSNSCESSFKRASFKRLKQKLHNHLSLNASCEELKMQTILNHDANLRNFINQKQADQVKQNEELNNKIDLEIRILDGILKLLNAICSCPSSGSAVLVPTLAQTNFNSPSAAPHLNGSLQSLSSNSSGHSQLSSASSIGPASVASILNNTFNFSSLVNQNQCTMAGQAIAAALIGSKSSLSESSSLVFGSSSLLGTHGLNSLSPESASLSSSYSSELNHFYQVLSACKCLFVSHRKIAIYLQNLQKIDNSSQRESETSPMNENDHHDADKASLAPSTSSSSSSSNLSSNHADETPDSIHADRLDGIKLESSKLMLSDIRIPLSWRWNEHVKATKSSENGSAKYATFALIYVGNMVYDTQLMLNVDATTTELSFNEVFIFDDVRLKDFQLNIEIYSYELFNTGNNILQSARKLAKQFADFASFKRNTSSSLQHQQQHQQSQQGASLANTMLLSAASNHSYSLHKFKLIAKSVLTHKDLSDAIESRDLQLINNCQPAGMASAATAPVSSISSNSMSSSLVYNQNSSSSNSNKLPLFDYYCCKLRTVPTSSEI